MNRKETERVIEALWCCLAEQHLRYCPRVCPYMDKTQRETVGVCADFEDSNLDVPTRLLYEALYTLIELNKAMDTIEELRNCANCRHFDVCSTVEKLKTKKANDYSACEKWELAEANERKDT